MSERDGRRYRGLTESIYLVKLEHVNNVLVFHVLGSSHVVYKVTCKKGQAPKCTCPDHKFRKAVCKHIVFVCERVTNVKPLMWEEIDSVEKIWKDVTARLPNLHVTDEYYTSRYAEILQNQQIDKKQPTEKEVSIRNDDCCVCLSELSSESTRDVIVCSTCHNGIHAVCWKKWKQVNDSNRCVYCRTVITSSKGNRDEKVKQAGWGIFVD